MVEKAVEQLQEFKLVETVNDTTTHVVCGDSRRTLNVMRAVVRGIRIVSFNWVRTFCLIALFTLQQFFSLR